MIRLVPCPYICNHIKDEKSTATHKKGLGEGRVVGAEEKG